MELVYFVRFSTNFYQRVWTRENLLNRFTDVVDFESRLKEAEDKVADPNSPNYSTGSKHFSIEKKDAMVMVMSEERWNLIR